MTNTFVHVKVKYASLRWIVKPVTFWANVQTLNGLTSQHVYTKTSKCITNYVIYSHTTLKSDFKEWFHCQSMRFLVDEDHHYWTAMPTTHDLTSAYGFQPCWPKGTPTKTIRDINKARDLSYNSIYYKVGPLFCSRKRQLFGVPIDILNGSSSPILTKGIWSHVRFGSLYGAGHLPHYSTQSHLDKLKKKNY